MRHKKIPNFSKINSVGGTTKQKREVGPVEGPKNRFSSIRALKTDMPLGFPAS